jgi:CHAD domain-containing protein
MAKSAAVHILAALRAQQEALATHEAGTRRGADPEELHRMRTAIRRLRSVLRAAPGMFGPQLGRELHWLGSRLSGIRDLDVFRSYLTSELPAMSPPEADTVRRILARIERERARAQKAVADTLASPRYTRLRKGLAKALGRTPHRSDAPDLSLVDAARRRFKKLRKAVKALPGKPSDEELHTVRIRVKRARYAAELAEPAVGRRARRFARKAGRVQDILGEHQDAVTAEARLRAMRNVDGGPALDRLLQRQQRRRRAAWKEFQEQWPRLERRGRKAWG